jgi:hypothetical protein
MSLVGVPLSWSRPDADHLVIEGKLASDVLLIRMRRIDESKFRLTNCATPVRTRRKS